jgi:hypothetical protein
MRRPWKRAGRDACVAARAALPRSLAPRPRGRAPSHCRGCKPGCRDPRSELYQATYEPQAGAGAGAWACPIHVRGVLGQVAKRATLIILAVTR